MTDPTPPPPPPVSMWKKEGEEKDDSPPPPPIPPQQGPSYSSISLLSSRATGSINAMLFLSLFLFFSLAGSNTCSKSPQQSTPVKNMGIQNIQCSKNIYSFFSPRLRETDCGMKFQFRNPPPTSFTTPSSFTQKPLRKNTPKSICSSPLHHHHSRKNSQEKDFFRS